MPGISTERMDLFLGSYAATDRVSAGGGLASENEEIEVIELPLADLVAMIEAGADMDVKVLALVQTGRLHPEAINSAVVPWNDTHEAILADARKPVFVRDGA